MNAVVLAGGVRSGLEIPGSGLPRALWPFPRRPLIADVLTFLQRSGCQGMAICANGKTKLIASELSSGATPWDGLRYSEDPLPRGPAGCLRDLAEWIGNETIVAIQGTASYDFDLDAMLREHRASGAAVTVGARRTDDGLLEPIGVFLVEPATLKLISPVGYQDIKEQFIPRVLANAMQVRCHQVHGRATLIHSPEHYVASIGEAIDRELQSMPAEFTRTDGGARHATAVVNPTARIIGPVWIEEGAQIGADALVMGPALIGPEARIDAGAMVRRSVLMRGASVGRDAMLESAILGPGAIHAGLRLPRFAPARTPARTRTVAHTAEPAYAAAIAS